MIIFCWVGTYLKKICPETVLPCSTTRNITLNMLCPSCPHQQLFDQFYISMQFDCETNPIGYPGTCVVGNVDNYYCHGLYIYITRGKEVINTVDCSPNFTMPCMPLVDTKTCSAHYVAKLLLIKSCQPHTIYQVHY